MAEPAMLEILHSFQDPLKPEAVHVEMDLASYPLLQDFTTAFNIYEEAYRCVHRLPSVAAKSAMALGADRRLVQNSMKSDPQWQKAVRELIDQSCIELTGSFDDVLKAITLPDWNALTARLHDIDAQSDKLSLRFSVAHSYTTQLNRGNLIPNEGFKAISVYGNVADRFGGSLFGVRGGGFNQGGQMAIPAGSLYLVPVGDSVTVDPYVALRKEMRDETGLSPEQYRIDGITGMFVERTSCNTYGLSFQVSTDMTEEELQRVWKDNGNAEHREVFVLPRARWGSYITEKAQRQRLPLSVIDPSYPLIPSGGAVLMIDLARTEPITYLQVLKDVGSLYDDLRPR